MSQDIDALLLRLRSVDPENPDSQWKACIELGDKPGARTDQRMTQALLEALNPRNFALTRAHAAEVLGKFLIDDDRVIESLIKSMENDRYQLVRSYAARALGNI
jgi:HEAT repeat protein